MKFIPLSIEGAEQIHGNAQGADRIENAKAPYGQCLVGMHELLKPKPFSAMAVVRRLSIMIPSSLLIFGGAVASRQETSGIQEACETAGCKRAARETKNENLISETVVLRQ